MKRKEIPRSKHYCHSDKGKICPYWSLRDDLPYHENGFCSYLGKSDWDMNEEQGEVEVTTYNKDHSIKSITMEDAHKYHISYLWDKIKECGR